MKSNTNQGSIIGTNLKHQNHDEKATKRGKLALVGKRKMVLMQNTRRENPLLA